MTSSKFPGAIDDDSVILSVFDNLTDIGADVINSLKDATINVENNIGVGAQGNLSSIAARLGVSIDVNGAIKPSALTGLGLIALPIVDGYISPTANIQESKLKLDHKTQDLYNSLLLNTTNINIALSWIQLSGVKLEPHLIGNTYRHVLSHIDISGSSSDYLKNKLGALRNNTNAYTLLSDINADFVQHQNLDGTGTLAGTVAPTNYAHVSSGVYLNPSLFSFIPQTVQDLQSFAQFIDNSNIFLYGTRIQNFYTNGVSRVSRSSSLVNDGYGAPVIPPTKVTTFLSYAAACSSNNSIDDIDHGDDVIQFTPTVLNHVFDSQFVNIRIGDILRINYGGVEVQFIIKEKKYDPINSVFKVRINGKNILATTVGSARIDRPLFNRDKYGVLSLSAVNNIPNTVKTPSLVASNPRSAVALGITFDPELFDVSHYNLYLAIYPTGNPADGYNILPAIDVTGDLGVSPGKYTLDSIIDSTNSAFRQNNFNYRFAAFQYEGQFGIMLADSYGNAGFSILSGTTDGYGNILASFSKNVIDVANNIDPLGFINANLAGPPYRASLSSADDASLITRIQLPLKRNTFYVNGVERERVATEYLTTIDSYGDGFWLGLIENNTTDVIYKVPLDLSRSKLAPGKTLVVQSAGLGGTIGDFGRFIIKEVDFSSCDGYTHIVVQNGVHANGSKANVGTQVRIYFSDDSIGFNTENVSDFSLKDNLNAPLSSLLFRRAFEIYINQDGKTFSHERARAWIGSGSSYIAVNGAKLYFNTALQNINLLKVSPKLRGYSYTSSLTGLNTAINKISFRVNSTDGVMFDGYLCNYNGTNCTNTGPLVAGKKGQVVRFYDESAVDFIDMLIDINDLVLAAGAIIDIQLFPSLQLDEELMLLGSCQLDDTTKHTSYIKDLREFGNVAEEDFSKSAINFINAGNKYLNQNGVVRGLDVVSLSGNSISLRGGLALVNGKFIPFNNETISIPIVQEVYSSITYQTITWALCANDNAEIILFPLTDTFDARPSNRLVNLKNPTTSTVYNVDGYTFSGIVNNRKDLTILYVVKSVVPSANSITATLSDARKFVNDVNSSIPITLTGDVAQGNFRSFESAASWVKFNGAYDSKIVLRGNSTINVDSGFLQFPSKVIIDGNGSGTLTINTPTTLSNVEVRNCNIVINVREGLILGSNTELVKNNITYNCPDATLDSGFFTQSYINPQKAAIHIPTTVVKNVNISSNTFTCTFDFSTRYRYPFISFEFNSQSNSYLSNINVNDNKFNDYFTVVDGDCLTSAISIVTTALWDLTAPDLFDYKVVNCNIVGNICNKNQQIAIGALRDGYSSTTFTPTLINVAIEKNVCGTIIYSNKKDTVQNTYNTSTSQLISDKKSGLFISKNNCKLIAIGDGYGRYATNNLYGGFGIQPTGPVFIDSNICSWIATQDYSDEDLGLTITNNRLFSYDINFLQKFQDLIYYNLYGNNLFNYAIYIENTYYLNIPSVNINNNQIYKGIFGSTTYLYDRGIVCNQAAIITDNLIRGLSSNTSNSIGIDFSGEGVVKGNRIYRDNSSIFAYIGNYRGVNNNAVVMENIFDSITLDGTNEPNLQVLIPSTWVYSHNKNQVGYVYIPVFENMFGTQSGLAPVTYYQPTGNDYRVYSLNAGVGAGTNTGTSFQATNGFTNTLLVDKVFNITQALDQGMTVIEIGLGAALANTSTLGINPSSVGWIFQENQKGQFTNDLDVFNNSSVYPIHTDGLNHSVTSSMVGATEYITKTPSFQPIINKNNHLFLLLYTSIEFANISTSYLYLSPIRIKYRW